MLTHLIAESLLKRIDRELLESKNIYIQQLDIPQIVMFYNMAKAVPFVEAGHFLANQYIAGALEGLSHADHFRHRDGQGRSAQGALQDARLVADPFEIAFAYRAGPRRKEPFRAPRDVDGMRAKFLSACPSHPLKGSSNLSPSNTRKSNESGRETF